MKLCIPSFQVKQGLWPVDCVKARAILPHSAICSYSTIYYSAAFEILFPPILTASAFNEVMNSTPCWRILAQQNLRPKG
jgi:hypothetical protein